jgi:hypothetical protein
MNGDQSRLLNVGDRVRRKDRAADLGTVTATARSGVTISWDNGHTASPQHNDMTQIERPPTKVIRSEIFSIQENDSNEKTQTERSSRNSQMRRLQWDGLPEGKATGTAGPSNFSSAVQGMRGQGAAHALLRAKLVGTDSRQRKFTRTEWPRRRQDYFA